MSNINPNPRRGNRGLNEVCIMAVCCLVAITIISNILAASIRVNTLYMPCAIGCRATCKENHSLFSYRLRLILLTDLGMNLSTARSEKRAKEVGIRKTLGSLRQQLINQFFSESLLVSAFAFGASLFLLQSSKSKLMGSL